MGVQFPSPALKFKMKNYSDEQLVTKYLKGDEKAFEILIKRYLKPIFNFAFRFVGNSEDAQDVTQEVFIKVWRHLKKFDKNKKFKTWIFTIAKNTCLDWLRKKQIIPFSELKYSGDNKFFIENIPDNHSLLNGLLERMDLENFLNKALEKLSPEYRMVLFLRYNNQLRFREIAEILEKPLNTVKSYHQRALILLRNFLGVK